MSATILYSDRYLDYNFGPEHPFSPTRQQMLLELLEAVGHPLDADEPPRATPEDILRVHDAVFVEQVQACSNGSVSARASRFGLDTQDVPAFEGMDPAARALCGGTLHGARLIADGTAPRVLQMGGGLHHAQRKLASGFCVYNDLSVAIQALRDDGWRVAYLDIDVHHGDGVQELHYDDPEVLTISLHESGRYLFPGTGSVYETGTGAGEGTSLNVPLEPFTETDSFLEVFEQTVPYALGQFQPEVLVVQCGADAHFSDPLADLLLTTQAYERLFRRILELADEHTDGRCLLTLGGGYQPDATVRIWAMLALLARGYDLPDTIPTGWHDRWQNRLDATLTPTFHDDPDRTFDVPRRPTIKKQNERVGKRVLEILAPLWY